MKLLVTGASGYIGRRLTTLALSRGHEIYAASRRPIGGAVDWIPYALDSASAPVVPLGTRAVVHLAADTSGVGELSGDTERRAARLLLVAAREAGAKMVFVSSQTARQDAPTSYGRTKWLIEQDVLAAGGWVVRPGQVYGADPSGLFGVLVGLVRRLPVLPAFVPAPKVQPIHVDDLTRGLLDIIEKDDAVPCILTLASPSPVTFTAFLAAIAQQRVHRRPLFLPVPTLLVSISARLMPAALRTRVGLDRLKSLFDLPAVESRESLDLLDLRLRPLAAGMHPSGDDRRRRLALEAFALLRYVLGSRPADGTVRRYARAVEMLKEGVPLPLPEILLRRPALVALLDARPAIAARWQVEFAWRVNAATVLAEASTQGASRFLGLGHSGGIFRSGLGLCSAVAREAAWRCAALACAPFLRRAMRAIQEGLHGN